VEKCCRAGQDTDDHITLDTQGKKKNTQNMYYVLFFHCNSGCANVPQCYIIFTLLVMYGLI